MQTKKQVKRLTPVLLHNPETAEELNFALRTISMEERETIKFIILDALRRRNPELTDLVDLELGR